MRPEYALSVCQGVLVCELAKQEESLLPSEEDS